MQPQRRVRFKNNGSPFLVSLFFKKNKNKKCLTLNCRDGHVGSGARHGLAKPENVFSDNPARDLQTMGLCMGWYDVSVEQLFRFILKLIY